MTNQVATINRVPAFKDVAPTASKHRYQLQMECRGGPYRNSPLPLDVVMAIKREIAAFTVAVTPKSTALALATKLACAYPARASDVDADMEAYLTLVAEELTAYPLAIVLTAIPGLWRTARFRPCVAEIIECLDEAMADVYAASYGVESMIRSHEEISAKAEAQAKGKAEAMARLASQKAARTPPIETAGAQ